MHSILNINAAAVKQHTQTLTTLRRSALPTAVRQTLNNAAYDVKTNTMPKESDRFVHRRPTFFKANSAVEQAKGFDVTSMKATVGFRENNGTQQQAVEDMQQQDEGGSIGGRKYIPTNAARVGGSPRRMVRAAYRIKEVLPNEIDSTLFGGYSKRQQFLYAAIYAGIGGFVLGNTKKKGRRMLMRIDKIVRKGRATQVYSKAIYSMQDGKDVDVNKTSFMHNASLQSASKMQMWYSINAAKQIMKLQKP